MSLRDPTVPLRHMLDHAEKALALVEGKDWEQIEGNEVLFLALTRLLEVLGEAATRVPEDIRSQYPCIPWRSVVGLRNVLIHGYDTIDPAILQRVLVEDVPGLLPYLKTAVESELGKQRHG